MRKFATAAIAIVLLSSCAAPAPPPPQTPSGPAAAPAPGPAVTPPPFDPNATPATPQAAADARTAMRRSILNAAWQTVRDKHYDPKLGGVDWNAVRAKYEPLALAAPSEAAFYRTLNQMIGELGQSHMMITGPGADDDDDRDAEGSQDEAAASSGQLGDPGLTVRMIEGRPTVTRVRRGSPAERAGIAPGYIVTQIAGRDLKPVAESVRPLRPVEERFALRRAAQRRLLGPAGTRVTVRYLDLDDRPGQAVLVRQEPSVPGVHLGYLPVLYPEVQVSERHDVGVIAFNVFLLDPVLDQIKSAIDRFRREHVRALILDLRGNLGGHGAMAIPVAARLVSAPLTLGTLQLRDFPQTLIARPEMGVTPFTGPVAILTDEGTASASEILAAGLQESGRAVVVGDSTLGAVLPSVVQALPGGAVMQYVVADFRTPKGVLLEGRGVQPDKRVIETRAGLRSGRDPVLDAALVAVGASRVP
jgi:carboxyl-terminal processing protease